MKGVGGILEPVSKIVTDTVARLHKLVAPKVSREVTELGTSVLLNTLIGDIFRRFYVWQLWSP